MSVRRWSAPTAGAAVAAQCRETATWLERYVSDGDDWLRPSALPGWTVAELAGHLVGSLLRPLAALSAPPPRRRDLDAVDYVRGTAAVADDVMRRAIADRAEPAAVLAGQLPDALRQAGAEVGRAAQAYPGERLVAARLGAIRWDDLLATRCVEVVVHTRDLARSLGAQDADGPATDPAAVRIAVTLLLAALERAVPGRTVEVRVPPYGAVQCVAGPRHTRGTPANVVEMAAPAWLDLATGRRTWAQARAEGAVSCSGTRADLGPWLPVMG